MADRRVKAFVAELSGAYPGNAITRETLEAYAEAFTDIGLDIADDVSALLRVRSTFPPSVAQIYEAAREVRKETKSKWSTWDCLFAEGVACPNCSGPGDPIVHGRLLDPEDVAAKLHDLGYPAESGSGANLERLQRAEAEEIEQTGDWQRVKTATLTRLRMHGTCLGTDKSALEVDGKLVCPVCRVEIVDPRKAART